MTIPRYILIGVLIAAPATAMGQSARDSAGRNARMQAAMAAAKARADSAAAQVKTIVVRPSTIELAVGDSMQPPELWRRFQVVGITASGDTLREFGKVYVVQPNPYVEQLGGQYVARRPGTATLWIYLGTEPRQPLFTETKRAARVRIRVR